VPKALGLDVSDDIIKAGCAFFGGGGGTGGRCGVIESGIILSSVLYGRIDTSVSEFDVKVVVTELLRRFKAKMGTHRCIEIKPKEVARFGADFGCRRVYEEGAALVAGLLLDAPRLIKEADPVRFAMKQTEDSLTEVFGSYEAVSENLTRHRDDALPDMYDLNYFEYDMIPEEDEIKTAFDYQEKRGDGFIKFEGRKPLPKEYGEKFGLEMWTDLTMVLTKGDPSLWARNTKVEVKDLHHDDIEQDLFELEMKLFGPVYGEDFAERKMKHWLKASKNTPALNFYGAYIDGKLAGSLYTYKGKDYTCIDGLAVDEQFRNQYVATTLLASAIEKEGGIAFLHAEEDDTPKDMYSKLGFEVADRKYNASKK